MKKGSEKQRHSERDKIMTRIVCAWCGQLIRMSKKEMSRPVSHSICNLCARHLENQFKNEHRKGLFARRKADTD